MNERALKLAFIATVLNLITGSIAFAQTTNVLGWEAPLGERRILVAWHPSSMERMGALQSIDWDGFKARELDFVVMHKTSIVTIVESENTRTADTQNWSQRWDESLHDPSDDTLREHANCRKGGGYALIGKDTGVKKRWSALPPMAEIFQTIDSMPMRRFEMRQQKRDKN